LDQNIRHAAVEVIEPLETPEHLGE